MECPRCKTVTNVERISRRWYERLLPRSRAYYCYDCGIRFLQVAGRIARVRQL